jgi:peptidoglycan/LPS O-acetylase OafA/YrhL
MPNRAGFRHDIEGLRGIAILLVIAFHAGVARLGGGFVGVDIFFVLSGYLITGILAREVMDTGDIDLAEFYARRARRLLPALLLVLGATLFLGLWLYAPIDQPAIASDARAVALHYANVLFAQQAVNYHAASSNPFLHTWSLAVEEQFYVVWPLLFMLLGRLSGGAGLTTRRLIAILAAVACASFVACVVVTDAAQPWAFFGMPTRIWEFALGGIASLAVLEKSDSWTARQAALLAGAGLAAIAVAVFAYHEAMPYPGSRAALPVAGALAILVGGRLAPENAVSRVIGAPLLQWFGRVSYSWYLWHWPLVGLGVVLDWKLGAGGKLAWSAAALGLAVITHRFVEEPVRRGALLRDRPAHQVNILALSMSAAAAAIAWIAMMGATQRASAPEQRVFAAARDGGMGHDCWGSYLENAAAPCEFGDLSSSTRVVLMGDSHAEHWLPAMDRIGRARHWKVYAMVKPACPVADVQQLVNLRLRREYLECSEWRRAMLKRIMALRPAIVVLSSWDHYVAGSGEESPWNVTPLAWRDGLRRTYSLLSNAGITTVALRDVPNAGFDVPSCLSRRASGAPFQLRNCEYELGESLRPSAIAAQTNAARGLPNVTLVDMTDQLCSTNRCNVVQHGEIVYRDGNHLTAAFSRAVAPVLGERIAAAAAVVRSRR